MFSDGNVLLDCKYPYLCSLYLMSHFAHRCPTQGKSERVSRSIRNTIKYRSPVEIAMASGFESLRRGGFAAKEAREDTIRHMHEMIKDPVILKKIMPD